MAQFRVLELCAGYGSQAMALKEIGLDIYSEIAEFDKYASEAYMQLHGETKNYGDIYKIDESKLPYFDMITYSTPCQDFSVAGNQRGGEKGSGTRSSLLWECERIIRAVKPKYLLMENVKNLMSDKFRHTFNEWFGVLESMGYRNYYKVLNAKDYGVPQNRERIFCVSILGNQQFLFPNPIKLEKRLKNVLEDNVDERYYIKSDKAEDVIQSIKDREISHTIRCGGRGSLDKNHCWDIVAEPLIAASRGRYKDITNYRIRKLTPRECWRLMGVPDAYFDKLHDLSNTQLYKLSGNSIVVDVLKAIFINLITPEKVDTKGQLDLF